MPRGEHPRQLWVPHQTDKLSPVMMSTIPSRQEGWPGKLPAAFAGPDNHTNVFETLLCPWEHKCAGASCEP